jgi:hypothetical protein
MKEEESDMMEKLTLELKYCERCGGLWLRPAGGGQIYCVGCARKIAELPASSREAETVEMPRGSQPPVEMSKLEWYGEDEGADQNAVGGVA